MSTSSRKLDHVRICLERQVESRWTPFDDIMLVHKALPEIDEASINTRCRFLGKEMKAPFLICAMTGGHPETREINVNLAKAAQEVGVALGIGSQRAALEDPRQIETFSAVRDAAPDVPIIGNIGAPQLRKLGGEAVDYLAEMVGADAVAVHLNFLQESIQPEGDRDASGVLEALKTIASGKTAIIVKETGAGISMEVAWDVLRSGVKTIDISGMGGTSWSGVEAYRAEMIGDLGSKDLGELFWSWGVPTPVSIVECASAGAEVVASGGIRSGLDAAKSIALGASVAGAALPFLKPATMGSAEVAFTLQSYIRALRTCMFLTGSRDLSNLKRAPTVILGRCREILEQRGLDTRKFSTYRERAK